MLPIHARKNEVPYLQAPSLHLRNSEEPENTSAKTGETRGDLVPPNLPSLTEGQLSWHSTPSPAPLILCVDDDPTSRSAMAFFLRQAGFRTCEASSGTEALTLAREEPDLILLDISLPDLDGFEVCRRLKAHPGTAPIPVLHISGVFVSTEDKTQGLDGGADGYLLKPVAPEEILATVRSLLRIREAEEVARVAAQQWRATFDAIPSAAWLVDTRDLVLRCNQSLVRLLERPEDQILGQCQRTVLTEAFGAHAPALLDQLHQPSTHDPGEWSTEARWFEVRSDRVLDDEGRHVGWVHLLVEITQRRLLEEQLGQAQKLEAVGRLAGGVAHDFNNLLTAITGNLTLLLRRTSLDDPARELLQMTEQAAWQAAELTRQLLGFARRARLQLQPTCPRICIEQTLSLLRRTLDPRIEIVVNIPEDVWAVYADGIQMQQVLMNLALNARDAMPRGGRMTITAANVILVEVPGHSPQGGLAGGLMVVEPQQPGETQEEPGGGGGAKPPSQTGGHCHLPPGQAWPSLMRAPSSAVGRQCPPVSPPASSDKGGQAPRARIETPPNHPFGMGRPGEFVRLQVSDTGEGIPPEAQAHIFEPFFTTKESGRGTGLGLALVFGIIQQHRGWVECHSTVGEGTRFDVFLPRCEEP